jgi:hypothetical protein
LVNKKRKLGSCLTAVLLGVFFVFAATPMVHAQVTYMVSQEWVNITINIDGSIGLQYNITVTYLSGQPQGIVTVGMPMSGFSIQFVQDNSGSTLSYQDSSQGSFYGIDVYLHGPIIINQPYTFIVSATVPNMIQTDSENPGNVGMQFYPTTFASASSPISDVRVGIVLPLGVQGNDTKYLSGAPFDGESMQGNNLVVFWERQNWPQADQFNVGVSFPQQFVSPAPISSATPSQGGGGISISDLTDIGVPILFVVFIVVIAIIGGAAKSAYHGPGISVEALGANRNLTAVEAGVVLSQKPVTSLTMILYGLLLKHMVTVQQTEPIIKLKKTENQEGDTPQTPRYYEIDYLKAIQADGTLNDNALALAYKGLVDAVDLKLRGYSREDTTNYYKSIVEKAWSQVTSAGTPELKGDAVDKNLDWLMTDDKFGDRFRTAFPPGIIIYPSPGWWWYWGGPGFPSSQARPIQPSGPTVTAKPGPLPGQDFANNVVKGMTSASTNIVKDIQGFADKLVPLQPKPQTSQHSVKGPSDCVCACHACACACACVGCACACAGGGAR